jgi:hypothetical protein
MFSLATGFYRYLFRKPEYYILMCGIDGAGKTVCQKGWILSLS